jgi:hydroxymethylglutaryl-CoA lyase
MKIVECPRDAMQGMKQFIPTNEKADYINCLLQVGFDTIDFGSFVSPTAIPQMKDTPRLLAALDFSKSQSKLLTIVANRRGAEEACLHQGIHYLGFPLSLSETFQQRNTKRSIDEAFVTLTEIQELCFKHNKTLVTYLSMGFGNPYGDPYETGYVARFVEKLQILQVTVVALADTIGVSTAESIKGLFQSLIPTFPSIEFGAHLHSTRESATLKIEAAYAAGCKRIDVQQLQRSIQLALKIFH